MATLFGSFEPEQWTHDWLYDPQTYFGDPDEDREYGNVGTIRADSPEQAEQRALTYIPANYDDPTSPIRAEAEPKPLWPGTYRVKVIWRGVR